MKTITFWFLVVLGLFVAACAGDDDSAPGADLPTLKVEGFNVMEGDRQANAFFSGIKFRFSNQTIVMASTARK